MDLNQIIHGDCLDVLRSMPSDSVDLVCGSPPYENARTYGIGFNLKGQAWVDWMLERMREMSRACRGLVIMVVEGKTEKFKWSATPALLMADLHRAGFNLRKPPIFHRVGIPGSGGPDWLRNDYEFCVCIAKPGKLPWSDNTAMGHPPLWAPGGEMSYRTLHGERINGTPKTMTELMADRGGNRRRPDGVREKMGKKRRLERGNHKGSPACVPTLANPGNVITTIVGGGVMGSDLAHESEAPFPESLVEFFVRSFCPPDTGIVLDPFSGSGTTCAVAEKWGRKWIGIDVRESQVELSKRRVKEKELVLFAAAD